MKPLAFLRGVHDLASYDGRRYPGFGDANLNLGRVFPIDLRAFTDPSDATAHAELIITAEEQIDRYRRVGPDLLMAGSGTTGSGSPATNGPIVVTLAQYQSYVVGIKDNAYTGTAPSNDLPQGSHQRVGFRRRGEYE